MKCGPSSSGTGNRVISTHGERKVAVMTRRAWIIAGLRITTPLLCFTAILAGLAFYLACNSALSVVESIENRTDRPIWVIPIATNGQRASSVAHAPTPLAWLWMDLSKDMLVPPGEQRQFVCDGWVVSDMGAKVVLVAKRDDEFKSVTSNGNGDFVIDDFQSLDHPDDVVLAAAKRDHRPVLLPAWLVVGIGSAAPIAFYKLRRAHRHQDHPTTASRERQRPEQGVATRW
jgi:hypothetical protein